MISTCYRYFFLPFYFLIFFSFFLILSRVQWASSFPVSVNQHIRTYANRVTKNVYIFLQRRISISLFFFSSQFSLVFDEKVNEREKESKEENLHWKETQREEKRCHLCKCLLYKSLISYFPFACMRFKLFPILLSSSSFSKKRTFFLLRFTFIYL